MAIMFTSSILNLAQPKLPLATPSPQSSTDDDCSSSLLPSAEQLSIDSNAASSRPTSADGLPRTLRDLVSLHESFLRAFSLHAAHHGPVVPADLGDVMGTVTRLWKKHTVTKEDIQRMLGLYEIGADVENCRSILAHKNGPFKLTTSGIGRTSRTWVEYVGGPPRMMTPAPFNADNLQALYKAEVEAVFISQRSNPTSFVYDTLANYPLLASIMGVQTLARKQHASARRTEILSLSSQTPVPSRVKSSTGSGDSQSTTAQIPESVKARTLSLIDRVRAKQLANASNSQPSQEAIVRHHAIGRVAEVVEILRMKQQQKLSSRFVSAVHASPSQVRGKVSFTLNQIVDEIRGSVSVPIGDQEVRMCIKILATEMPGFWLSTFELGGIQSVVLNGPGASGAEVKKVLEDKEKMPRAQENGIGKGP